MLDFLVEAASSYAEDIDRLFIMIAIIVGFWFFVAQGILFYLIFRFRKRKQENAQYVTGEKKQEKNWIHIPHYLIILCDVVIIAYTIILWQNIKTELPPPDELVKIVGKQWAWDFIYPGPDGKLDTKDDVISTNEMHVKENLVYHFKLESIDVIHDFSVPVFRLKQDAIPGRRITGWFKAIKKGKYDIQCAEMCGIGHGLMAAKLTVESKEDFDEWVKQLPQVQIE